MMHSPSVAVSAAPTNSWRLGVMLLERFNVSSLYWASLDVACRAIEFARAVLWSCLERNLKVCPQVQVKDFFSETFMGQSLSQGMGWLAGGDVGVVVLPSMACLVKVRPNVVYLG